MNNLFNALVDAKKSLTDAGVSGFKFEVSGHTDSTGRAATNKKLSKKRAAKMVKELVKKGIAEKEILDLKMVRKSGHDVLRVLRESTTFMNLPVVILSAYLEQPPAGAVAWLKKPVNPALLLSTIHHYLGRPAGPPRVP